MHTCQIEWVDSSGQPTPDSNPAIGRCRVEAYDRVIHGRSIHFPTSQWFCICAEHAKQLANPGMEIWSFEAFETQAA
jgi:hypothetical protein